MNENQRVHRYTVAFKEYADELRWADDVLHPLYYRGLPDRIKDLWARSDPPPLFADLVAQAQRADLRYWRRIDEKKKIQTPGKPSTSEHKASDQKSQSSTPAKSGQSSKPSSSSTPNKTASTSSSTPRTPTKTNDSYKDLSAVLGPDGKLLPEEKERRKKLGLCLRHGVKDDCPPPGSDKSNTPKPNKSASTSNMPKPKGRTAQAEDASDKSDSEPAASADASDF